MNIKKKFFEENKCNSCDFGSLVQTLGILFRWSKRCDGKAVFVIFGLSYIKVFFNVTMELQIPIEMPLNGDILRCLQYLSLKYQCFARRRIQVPKREQDI